jgi:hypothetical protein
MRTKWCRRPYGDQGLFVKACAFAKVRPFAAVCDQFQQDKLARWKTVKMRGYGMSWPCWAVMHVGLSCMWGCDAFGAAAL